MRMFPVRVIFLSKNSKFVSVKKSTEFGRDLEPKILQNLISWQSHIWDSIERSYAFTLTSQLGSAKADIIALETENKFLRADVDRLTHENIASDIEIEKLGAKIAENEEYITDFEKQFITMDAIIAEQDKRLDSFDANMTAVERELDEVESQLDTMNAIVEEQNEKILQTERKTGDVENDLNDVLETIGEHEIKMNQTDIKLDDFNTKIAVIENQLIITNTIAEEHEQKITQNESKLKDCEENITSVEQKLSDVEAEVSAITDIADELVYETDQIAGQIKIIEQGRVGPTVFWVKKCLA